MRTKGRSGVAGSSIAKAEEGALLIRVVEAGLSVTNADLLGCPMVLEAVISLAFFICSFDRD
jgi:hypothetical protein